MYKCPNADCSNVVQFRRDAYAIVVETLDKTGTVIQEDYLPPGSTQRSPARCVGCNALAEWIDTRQLEMFELQPTLA